MSFMGYTLLLYSNLLSIIIILERMSLYSTRVKFAMQKFSINSVIIFTILLSILINVPIYFHHTVRSSDEFHEAIINLNKTLQFTYCGESNFYRTLNGKLVLAFLALFRDFGILVLEILISYFSICHLKRYLKKKQQTLRLIRFDSPTNNHNNNNNNIDNDRIKKKLTVLNRRLTDMTISLTILSIVCNMFSFAYVVLYISFQAYSFSFYFILSHYFIVGLRHGSNIFFYSYYNAVFRVQFFNYVLNVIEFFKFCKKNRNSSQS